MVKIIDNCCSPEYLNMLKNVAITSNSWNMNYPIDREDKFLKLNIIDNRPVHPYLAGLAVGLLLQIYEASGHEFFIPECSWCGISIKDKHTEDNAHIDNSGYPSTKILGILNTDWEEEWGGGFIANGISTYAPPTSFWIFDSTEPHSAAPILINKKRIAIDFSVFKDQQSLLEKDNKFNN
jgi:hypothetical protein